jgi:hypothetical protein
MQVITMKLSTIQLAKILTYSGTLPLIACFFLQVFPVSGFDGNLIAKAYGAIIISFLCGIHWATYLFFAEKCPRNLLLTSNLVSLLAWSSLLILNQQIVTLLQVLCFVYLLILDLKLRAAGILPGWFYTLRRNATVIVVSSLIAITVLS